MSAATTDYSNHSAIPSTTTPTRSHLSPATSGPTSAPTSAGSLSSNGFTSPSAYINDQYHASQPNTPHGPPGLQHTLNYGVDDSYNYAYHSDYSDPHGFGAPPPVDQSTPSAPTRLEDDRTPVVSDQQHPIHPSSMPSHPGAKPLMSPFKPYQGGMMYPPGDGSPTYYDHGAIYAHGMPYYDGSPIEQNSFGQLAMPPQFVDPMATQAPPEQYQPVSAATGAAGTGYDFGPPPRSSNGSPNSTVSSSAASLTRSASTSSELRVRPKVKLTFEDKRNIVELHRANTSLRQEDIARQYGVDRSTISKIILSAHRWTSSPQNDPIAQSRSAKSVGGRFPAIDAAMDRWMDQEIAAGRDVRDNIARDQAKAIARDIGFPMDRFKASAKWLDKFKDRRRAAGKPTSSAMHLAYGYYPPYPNMAYQGMPPMGESVMLSRSQSTLTLSSSDSSGADQYQPSPGFLPSPGYMTVPPPINLTRSESDLTTIESVPVSRQRSQSSPQLIVEPGTQTPSSGKALKAVRPSPLSLHRQNSYHGTSPSPRRPAPLSRANSSQGTFGAGVKRPGRPTSLAASAFGITPINADEAYSPMPSPSISISSSGTHSRQRSDASLTPFTHSMGVMSISPDMAEGDVRMPMPMSIPPMTPITPGHPGAHAVFPNTDYAEIGNEMPMAPNMHPHHAPPVHQAYATMPNKHYVSPGYMPYSAPVHSDFGPAYPAGQPEMHHPMQWH